MEEESEDPQGKFEESEERIESGERATERRTIETERAFAASVITELFGKGGLRSQVPGKSDDGKRSGPDPKRIFEYRK